MSGKGKRGNKVNKETIPVPQMTVSGLVNELTPRNKDINRSAFLGFLQNLIGAEVEVYLVDGTTYRATYYTSTPFDGKKLQIVFKNARKLDEDVGTNAGTTLIFQFDQIRYITAVKSKIVSALFAQSKELETDAMLSRKTNIAELEGRDLQSIDSSWLTPETTAQLDSRHTIGTWNQFEANKRLYNYQDTYDENLYTKRLDRSQLTREQLERAHHLAIAIETSTTTNFHLREERGQISTGEEENYDEEDRYSGVLRQPSPGGNSRTHSKAKNSPTGSWKRVNLSSQTTVSSSSSTSTSTGSSWGSKPSYAAAAYKNSQPTQNSSKSDPTLPPGFGATPSTEGGYFKSNIDVSNIEPNISFYGTSDAIQEEKEAEPAPEAKSETVAPVPEKQNEPTPETSMTLPIAPEVVSAEPESVSKAPESTLSPSDVGKPDTPSDTSSVTSISTTSTTPVTTKLRATASEWKPPSSTASPTAAATLNPPSNSGFSNGNSNGSGYNPRTKNNKNRSYRNNNYQNNAGYDQSNMYQTGYNFDPNQMYQPHYQDLSGMYMGMPFDPNAAYYPPQFIPTGYDPSFGMPMPVFVVPPDMLMPMHPPPPHPYYPMELVGMDNGSAGVSVAPALSDVGMTGHQDSQGNEGN